jgi:hypothetical protein
MTPIEAAQFAAAYVDECARNVRNPDVTLAGRLHLSAGDVRRRREFIGEKGYLVGRRQGRPGGRLSAKAEEVLRLARTETS